MALKRAIEHALPDARIREHTWGNGVPRASRAGLQQMRAALALYTLWRAREQARPFFSRGFQGQFLGSLEAKANVAQSEVGTNPAHARAASIPFDRLGTSGTPQFDVAV
jgi:hypothetical protein